jgi:predicted amidophosphoribosyltransferase
MFQSLEQYIPSIALIVAILVAAIALFTFRKRSRISMSKAPTETMKYCISCGAQIKASSKYCTKCGETQK